MKSIVTLGLIARTRSAMNTKPPLSTHTRWISSPGGYAASISAASSRIRVWMRSFEISVSIQPVNSNQLLASINARGAPPPRALARAFALARAAGAADSQPASLRHLPGTPDCEAAESRAASPVCLSSYCRAHSVAPASRFGQHGILVQRQHLAIAHHDLAVDYRRTDVITPGHVDEVR